MSSKKEVATDQAPQFDQTKFPFSQAVSITLSLPSDHACLMRLDFIQWYDLLLWQYRRRSIHQEACRR